MHRIAQITDLHLDHKLEGKFGIDTRKNLLAVLDDIGRRSVDEIILTGDLAEDSGIDWLMKTLNELNISYSYIFGNHDERSRYPLSESKGKTYYKRNINKIQSLFLDSGDGIIDTEQLRWLKSELAKEEGPFLLFIHHPILDCHTLFMDIQYPLKNRTEVGSVLRESKREIWTFCGHYHMEDERTDGNIRQFVTPSTYYQIRADAEDLQQDLVPFGYRMIEIGSEISSKVIRVS